MYVCMYLNIYSFIYKIGCFYMQLVQYIKNQISSFIFIQLCNKIIVKNNQGKKMAT